MKSKIMILVALAAMTFSSCSDFLDNQPEGVPTKENYFKSDQDAIDAVDALYERFHQEGFYGRELMWEQGAACDIVWGKSRSWPWLATFNYTPYANDPVAGVLQNCYDDMARCNYVISMLLNKEDKQTLSAVEKRSLGEAFFCRGWAHFLVAYRYGLDTQGVPFVRWEDFPGREYDNSIPPQQESVMKDYELIIEDFESAKKYLPRYEEYAATDRGRAHKAACVAFEVRTYLYWATWDASKMAKVIDCVNDLETTYGRDLEPNFADLFVCDTNKWWGKEYLWSIPCMGGAVPGGVELPGVMLENKGWGIMNGWGQIKPTNDLYEEMAKDNVDGVKNSRLARTILEYNDEFPFFGETRRFYSASDIESGFMFNKYMEPFGYADPMGKGYVSTNPDWPIAKLNFPIIRFAEMLLARAEAYMSTGKAAKATIDINRVRTRSGLKTITGTATWTDLYHERRCELAIEYTDHLFDLKRWAKNGDPEIKALSLTELNKHPDVRHYEQRGEADSPYVVGPYEDYNYKNPYSETYFVFPYPIIPIIESNGALKQNPGYPDTMP